MRTLIVIPARAGSKGLPGKNTRKLGDKPLIEFTINFALKIKKKLDTICVTTDDEDIINFCDKYKSIVIQKRPKYLSNDKSGMSDVLKHTLKVLNKKSLIFDKVLLLQPTSPFRLVEDYLKLSKLLDFKTEMVVSVKESKANPYFNLFEENSNGFLEKSKYGEYKNRQSSPKVFEYNGSMYLIKVNSLLSYGLHGVKNIKKFVMPKHRSIDIDDINDWIIAEYYYNNLTNFLLI